MAKTMCCWIDNGKNSTTRGMCCGKSPADWVIEYGPAVDDYTESCSEHLGYMMTDAKEHRIYRAPDKPFSMERKANRKRKDL